MLVFTQLELPRGIQPTPSGSKRYKVLIVSQILAFAVFKFLLLLLLVESDAVNPFLSQIDSWWYYKDELQGVSNWSELPEIFPNGLDFIQESTGWPMVAHNR